MGVTCLYRGHEIQSVEASFLIAEYIRYKNLAALGIRFDVNDLSPFMVDCFNMIALEINKINSNTSSPIEQEF